MKKLLLILITFFAVGCGGEELTDEDRIEALIKDVATSASDKDVKGVMKHVSKDYRDDRGHDYRNVKGLIFSQLIRGDSISVFVRSTKVQVKDTDALARVNVILARGAVVESISDIIPDQSGGYRFKFVLKKIDDQWLVTSADWENVGAAALL